MFFAGANENDENGLLTALELRIVDLTGTKLVKSGESRCRALKKVQIDCLNEKFSGKTKQFSHPYYWASFVLSGKWSNLE